MREIKFRALSPNKKAWWYSTDEEICLKQFEDGLYLCFFDDMPLKEEECFKKIGKAIQHSGLIDKNGVEIYEGDIVRAACRNGYNSDNCIYVVVYDNLNTCFFGTTKGVIQSFGNSLNCIHSQPMSEIRQNIEVIGNIYKDKELLSEEKQNERD